MQNKEYVLIGNPLIHSISHEIHKRLFELSGISRNYNLRQLDPETFNEAVKDLVSLAGFNVTIPYKQKIIPFLATVDERASRYGAVNTVKCDGTGMHGYNTDVGGFLKALSQAEIQLTGNVLLCGAGGVARMMASEALDHGCSLVIATRTFSKASKFADDLLKLYPTANIAPSTLNYLSGSFDLILNGTPCGMHPNVQDCPVPAAVARSAGAVFDAIYNPYETRLLARARAAGAKVQGGLTMLVWQAVAAHEIWEGSHFEKSDIEHICDEMRKLIKNDI